MGKSLTEAQVAFAKLYKMAGPAFSRATVRRLGLEREFTLALRGHYIELAGYETSVKGEDWLRSDAGRAALERNDG